MNTSVFVALALTRPMLVGALAPSSRCLARAMAREAQGATAVIELGAGTGAVTAALCETAPRRALLAVEFQADLATGLQRRFPNVEVACAPAHEVLDSRRQQAPAGTALVSSLPFRSLPQSLRDVTLSAVLAFVMAEPGRQLVQYTYQPRAPFALPAGSPLQWSLQEVIWRNLPPAGVWVLRRAAGR